MRTEDVPVAAALGPPLARWASATFPARLSRGRRRRRLSAERPGRVSGPCWSSISSTRRSTSCATSSTTAPTGCGIPLEGILSPRRDRGRPAGGSRTQVSRGTCGRPARSPIPPSWQRLARGHGTPIRTAVLGAHPVDGGVVVRALSSRRVRGRMLLADGAERRDEPRTVRRRSSPRSSEGRALPLRYRFRFHFAGGGQRGSRTTPTAFSPRSATWTST